MSRRAVLLFAMMAVIWGIPYLFIRIAVGEITPATLVFARTGLASLILLPIALWRVDLRPILARWRWVVAFAAIEVGGPWVLLGSAEQHISSSLAGLLVASVPLIGTVVAFVSGGHEHRVGRSGALGLLVGLAGVAAIVGLDVSTSDAPALVAMFFVASGYAVGPAILARKLRGLPAVGVQALSMSLCALVYLPIAVAQRPATLPSPNVLAAVSILGVVCTAVAFLGFSALIDEIGPVRATVITYVNPAVAALLGVLVLNESLSAGMIAGFGLVLLGSALATRAPSPARSTGPALPEGTPVSVAEP